MKLRISLKVIFSVWLTAAVVVSSPLAQTSQSSAANRPAARPLNMLVLGDSILWGEGLKTEHKAWYHVKLWLERNSGRQVIERIEAHAGAVIERSSVTDNFISTNPEVNVALPTVNDEIDSALRSYADGSKVDLVLISACGNDVTYRIF
jgi:lysophospholipase L1-like esterase